MRSIDNREQLGLAALDHGVQASGYVLVEVRCGAMGIERGLVVVLFVKAEVASIIMRLLANVQAASWLFAGILLHHADLILRLFFGAGLYPEIDDQGDHRSSNRNGAENSAPPV